MERFVLILCAGLFGCLAGRASAEFQTPVAITNVTVHDGAGSVFEAGTILMAQGRIVDVGTDVTIPSGTEVIEAAGLHAYPGFIDAHSHYGMPEAARSEAERKRLEDENPDATQGPLVSTRRANRRGIRPQVRARDMCAPDADEIEAYHKEGFAVALVTPRGGIFGGSSSVVSITTTPVRRAVVVSDLAQHASFDPAEPGRYPRTILGTIAAFRQFCYDVQWYGHYARYLERHPRGDRRLPGDPALEALEIFLRGGGPVIFEANTEVEIIRALNLAEEFNLRVWISGGREAYKVVARLKAERVPVIVSLKFDEEPDYGKKPDEQSRNSTTQPADEPESKTLYEPLKVREERRRLWEEQVANLKTLSDAGILVALSSRGLENPGELIGHLRMVIERGLPAETALAALTRNAALLFGLGESMGTIEPGRMAHVTLMTAPFESDEAHVKQVFVEDKSFEYKTEDKENTENERPEKTEAAPDAPEPGAPSPAPTELEWQAEIEADRKPKTQTAGNVLITGATVITISGDTIHNGSILVRDGKIAEVGRTSAAPEGFAVIDAAGLYVMPGMIDCHSHMAIDAANEGSLSISAEVRVGDVINHRQVAIYRALAGGVTTIHTMHGSANTIGGQNAILKLRYGKAPAEMIFTGAKPTMKFALGENVTLKNRRPSAGPRFPGTRMGVESVLRQALTAAREYGDERRAHSDQLALGEDVPPLRRDLRLEALAAVLAGDLRVHCHGYRADEYLRLFAVAEDFGFRIAVLQHALEAYRIAPEIARHGCGVSTFSNFWAYKIEAFNAMPYNAAFLTRRGVNVSLNSDSPDMIRYLNTEAGKCVRWGGLDEMEALKLVTLNPARQLGIDGRVGSIEVGKDADLALFNGHPLDSFSKCVMTLIDGEVFFEHPAPRRAAPVRKINRAPRDIEPIATGQHALYALVNATVHPITAPVINRGTVIIRNDRIDAVGAGIGVPPGAVVVDLGGAHVFPGMIDAGSSLGMAEIEAAPQTRDEQEIARIQPELRAASAINPFSEHLRVARAVGITTALSCPIGGWISGRSALIHLDGWTVDEMLHGEDVALHMAVPSLPFHIPEKDREKRQKEYDRRLKELEDFLRRAKHYAEALQTGIAGTEKKPSRDLRLEAMVPYVRGEKPVVFTANSYKSIVDSIDFAKKHGLRCIISGGREAWKCADFLAKEEIPVIISTVVSLPQSDYEPFDSVFACAAALDRARASFCFASASAAGVYDLPIHAGMAVAHGLDPQRAMHALTFGAAEILGVADQIGSVEPGKIANVIVSSDVPIQVTASVTHVFIRGKPVDMSTIHTRNLDRFRKRPAPLLPPPPSLVGPPSLTGHP